MVFNIPVFLTLAGANTRINITLIESYHGDKDGHTNIWMTGEPETPYRSLEPIEDFEHRLRILINQNS